MLLKNKSIQEVIEKPCDEEGASREKERKKQWREGKKRKERRKEGIKFILSLREICK